MSKIRLLLFSLFPVLLSSGLLAACASPQRPRYELALGTICSVDAYDDGSRALYDEVFSCLHEITAIFDLHEPSSEISRLNSLAGSGPVAVSDRFYFVLQQALAFAAASDGAFSPALRPLTALWGIGSDHARLPAAEEIAVLLPLCRWQDIELQAPCSVFLKKKGMALDLGAIVKGYAADQVVEILRRRQVRRALINLGGNVYVYGKKKDGSLWQVGVKNPLAPEEEPLLTLSLEEGSVVTSGSYERFFEQDGIRYHHILNPASGRPAESGLLSVTVTCKSSLTADALSTALFVLGLDRGRELLKGFPDAEACFVDRSGAVVTFP